VRCDRNRILKLGRPHWIKGCNYALDACKILKDNNFNFRYTIVGGANLELIHQIQDLNLENEITIIDHIPFDEVQKHIKKSDLLLLPSNKEGIANVVLEAMASKTIVLSTDCGGMKEVIKNEINGFITPIRDPEAMAKKILNISELSKNQKEEITNNALEIIKQHHTEESMINSMLDFYNTI